MLPLSVLLRPRADPGVSLSKICAPMGMPENIYPVNPRGGRLLGMKVYKTIEDLPSGIDLAIVILAAQATPQAVRDCAARKIGSIVLVAGGFAEVDHAGEDLQEELARAARETGVRVLGPNTAGHISTPADFTSSFFPLGKIPKGGISYVAQTGNFTGAMMKHIMSAENYGVARCIGLGNTVDIDETDVFEFLATDKHTDAIFFYLESLRRPRDFIEIARKVTPRKPVIMLKGRGDAGRVPQRHCRIPRHSVRMTVSLMVRCARRVSCGSTNFRICSWRPRPQPRCRCRRGTGSVLYRRRALLSSISAICADSG